MKKRPTYHCKICNNDHIIRKCKNICKNEGLEEWKNTDGIFYCKVCDKWFFYQSGNGYPYRGGNPDTPKCSCCKSVMHETNRGLVYAIKTRHIDVYELLNADRDQQRQYNLEKNPTTFKNRFH